MVCGPTLYTNQFDWRWFFGIFMRDPATLSGDEVPFGRCLWRIGEAALSHAGGAWWPRARPGQTALMCNRRPAAASSRRASFSALASA